MTNELPAAPALSLQRCIQVYDDGLDPALCAKMIESFHALGRFQRQNGEGHRAGLEASGWTELDITPLSDPAFRGMLMAQMQQHLARYNAALGLTIPVPPSAHTSEWIIKRYQPDANHRFQPHFDSLGPVANRYLVFLWYLNDVAAGGETYFTDLDIAVQPKAGRLLMFPPYWMFQHEGRRPLSGDKYILSTYYLFR
jgi:prolyl 4-hydroxylase